MKAKDKPTVTMQDVRTFLGELDKAELVEMVITQAKEDDRLRQSLLLRAAKVHKKGLDLDVWRQAIDDPQTHMIFMDFISNYPQNLPKLHNRMSMLMHGRFRSCPPCGEPDMIAHNMGASILARLRNHAQVSRQDFNFILTHYAIIRLL